MHSRVEDIVSSSKGSSFADVNLVVHESESSLSFVASMDIGSRSHIVERSIVRYRTGANPKLAEHSSSRPKQRSQYWHSGNISFPVVKETDTGRTDPPFPEEFLLDPVEKRLSELSRLEADWDSYGSLPPSMASIAGALGFVRLAGQRFWRVYGGRVRPTSISPLPSGGIELEWQNPSELFAVEIAPDGRWGYLRKRGSGRAARYDEGIDLTQDQLLPLLAEVLLPRS